MIAVCNASPTYTFPPLCAPLIIRCFISPIFTAMVSQFTCTMGKGVPRNFSDRFDAGVADKKRKIPGGAIYLLFEVCTLGAGALHWRGVNVAGKTSSINKSLGVHDNTVCEG